MIQSKNKMQSNAINMKRIVLLSDIQLLIAAASFSSSFVIQRAAVSMGLGPFIFNASRFFMSTVFLLSSYPFIPDSLKVIKSQAPGEIATTINSLIINDRHQIVSLKWGIILGK